MATFNDYLLDTINIKWPLQTPKVNLRKIK
uniref:Uncharacterized protein n=1 Tax=Anguilla anguilla TaxID=7936 RepID=A0A0E9V787_ANGAN